MANVKIILDVQTPAQIAASSYIPDIKEPVWRDDGYIAYGDGVTVISALVFLPIFSGGIYNLASPSTVTVGGSIAGSILTGKTANQILEEILVQYQLPAFVSFGITGQSSPIVVGTTVSGLKTFTWAASNPGNVTANTVTIRDNTAGVDLATGLSNDGTENVNIGTVTKNTATSNTWRISGTNTQSGSFLRDYTVSWQWERYYGTSANTVLNEAQIEALTTQLSPNIVGNYSFIAGDYKYLVWDDSLGSPTATTGIKDTATNFPVAMATVSDNAAYSNVQNGWYYALVSVTNSAGVTSNKRVYRTLNTLGGSINIIVS